VEEKRNENKKIVFLFRIERFCPHFGFISFGERDNFSKGWAYEQALLKQGNAYAWLNYWVFLRLFNDCDSDRMFK
jgi:hypothetical protein